MNRKDENVNEKTVLSEDEEENLKRLQTIYLIRYHLLSRQCVSEDVSRCLVIRRNFTWRQDKRNNLSSSQKFDYSGQMKGSLSRSTKVVAIAMLTALPPMYRHRLEMKVHSPNPRSGVNCGAIS